MGVGVIVDVGVGVGTEVGVNVAVVVGVSVTVGVGVGVGVDVNVGETVFVEVGGMVGDTTISTSLLTYTTNASRMQIIRSTLHIINLLRLSDIAIILNL